MILDIISPESRILKLLSQHQVDSKKVKIVRQFGMELHVYYKDKFKNKLIINIPKEYEGQNTTK